MVDPFIAKRLQLRPEKRRFTCAWTATHEDNVQVILPFNNDRSWCGYVSENLAHDREQTQDSLVSVEVVDAELRNTLGSNVLVNGSGFS